MLMAKMANMSQTAATTTMTFETAPTESNKLLTINFIDLLWEMTLKGLKVLSNLKILMTGNSTFVNIMSNKEVNTIKPSS